MIVPQLGLSSPACCLLKNLKLTQNPRIVPISLLLNGTYIFTITSTRLWHFRVTSTSKILPARKKLEKNWNTSRNETTHSPSTKSMSSPPWWCTGIRWAWRSRCYRTRWSHCWDPATFPNTRSSRPCTNCSQSSSPSSRYLCYRVRPHLPLSLFHLHTTICINDVELEEDSRCFKTNSATKWSWSVVQQQQWESVVQLLLSQIPWSATCNTVTAVTSLDQINLIVWIIISCIFTTLHSQQNVSYCTKRKGKLPMS